MIALIVAGGLVLAMIVFGFALQVTVAGDAPSKAAAEPNAHLGTKEQRAGARRLINERGYDCLIVDWMVPFVFGEGWTVYCNRGKYAFEIANHGGRWSVKAN